MFSNTIVVILYFQISAYFLLVIKYTEHCGCLKICTVEVMLNRKKYAFLLTFVLYGSNYWHCVHYTPQNKSKPRNEGFIQNYFCVGGLKARLTFSFLLATRFEPYFLVPIASFIAKAEHCKKAPFSASALMLSVL